MVVVGTGTIGTKIIREDWPNQRGLVAGTTKHLVDEVNYDDECSGGKLT